MTPKQKIISELINSYSGKFFDQEQKILAFTKDEVLDQLKGNPMYGKLNDMYDELFDIHTVIHELDKLLK